MVNDRYVFGLVDETYLEPLLNYFTATGFTSGKLSTWTMGLSPTTSPAPQSSRPLQQTSNHAPTNVVGLGAIIGGGILAVVGI
jgi:hypothetical protein